VTLHLQPRLLDRAAAAAYCGVTAGYFTLHVEPHIRSVHVHRRKLYDRRSIDAWIDGDTPTRAQRQIANLSEDDIVARAGA
jgi:hypothetical protein